MSTEVASLSISREIHQNVRRLYSEQPPPLLLLSVCVIYTRVDEWANSWTNDEVCRGGENGGRKKNLEEKTRSPSSNEKRPFGLQMCCIVVYAQPEKKTYQGKSNQPGGDSIPLVKSSRSCSSLPRCCCFFFILFSLLLSTGTFSAPRFSFIPLHCATLCRMTGSCLRRPDRPRQWLLGYATRTIHHVIHTHTAEQKKENTTEKNTTFIFFKHTTTE